MRIAHLSDVHVVAPRGLRPAYRARARAVNFGKAADPSLRAVKLARALAAVKASGAEHLVISGDLTELGDDAEFRRFGEILEAAELDPRGVILVPGNHDAYTTSDGFVRALRGPLAPWAAGSARAGEVRIVERSEVVFVPLDVTRHQSILRSSGVFGAGAAAEILRLTADAAASRRAVVVVMHHPPHHRYEHAVGRWIDSLEGGDRVGELLASRPTVHVLHGHFHEALDRGRVFGAPAVSDDGDTPRVRLYDVRDGLLRPSVTA